MIYSNTFGSQFYFDDKRNIVENLKIRDLSNLKAIWQISPTRFLTFFSLAVNYHFHKLNVAGYHLFNLLVHLGAAILTWRLTFLTLTTPAIKDKKISPRANLIAFFAGLIFVAHPIQTQGVTYIFQRTASLATFFYLASLILYVQSRLAPQERRPPGIERLYYFGSLIAAVMAMLTKEITLTLPLVIVLYEFFFLRMKSGMNWRRLMPFFAISGLIFLLIFTTKSVDFRELKRLSDTSREVIPAWNYLLTQFRVGITYLRLLFLPINQNLDYDYPVAQSLFELPTLGSLLFLAIILVTAVRIFFRYRLMSFGIFWVFITLLPESSFIPIRDVIFEHRLYLPMFGYSLFLASAAYYFWGRKNLRTITVILLAVVISYSLLAYRRNFVWKNEFSLWDDTVKKSPHKARPYNNRGIIYADRGDYDKAIADFDRALQLDPDYAKAYFNRGNLHANKNNFNQAMLDYSKAIEKYPDYAKAYVKRGVIYLKKGNFDQSLADYNRAIQIEPDYGDAYNDRAVAYFLKKEYNKAWEDIDKLQGLRYKVNTKFLEELKKASGRENQGVF